jgi:hypothetical protein
VADAIPEGETQSTKDARQRFEEQLAAERERNERNEKRIEQMERNALFDKLGIPEDGSGKLFRDTYTGDMDAAKMREAAEGYGVLTPKVTTPPEEQQGLEVMFEDGGPQAGQNAGDPKVPAQMLEDFKRPEFDDSDLFEKHLRNIGVMPKAD